jgi:hypothetical protein
MNKDASKKMKQNLTDGLSAAAGATVGSVLGSAFMGAEAMAAENPQGEDAEVLNATPAEPAHAISQHPAAETPIGPTEEVTGQVETPEAGTEPEVQVLSYDHVTMENGVEMEVAQVQEGDEIVVYIDSDVDGVADLKWEDANHDAQTDQNELTRIQDEHIEMSTFQEAADYNPEYAQNNIPDYVNDADGGTYTA